MTCPFPLRRAWRSMPTGSAGRVRVPCRDPARMIGSPAWETVGTVLWLNRAVSQSTGLSRATRGTTAWSCPAPALRPVARPIDVGAPVGCQTRQDACSACLCLLMLLRGTRYTQDMARCPVRTDGSLGLASHAPGARAWAFQWLCRNAGGGSAQRLDARSKVAGLAFIAFAGFRAQRSG